MSFDRKHPVVVAGALASLLVFSGARGQEDSPVPKESLIARSTAGQRVLVSSCDVDADIQKRAWRLTDPSVDIVRSDPTPKFGSASLRFSAMAPDGGGKGDFVVAGRMAQSLRAAGMWVCLGADSNVQLVGMQFVDAEEEHLIALIPADWTGWKWIEFDATDAAIKPAYDQPGKNGALDGALRGLSVAWFAKGAGKTALNVDGIVAVVEADPGARGVQGKLTAAASMEPGETLAAEVMLTNYTDAPAAVTVDYVVQDNQLLHDALPPDPVLGTNHALGAVNRAVSNGKTVDEGSLTDGSVHTAAGTPWSGGVDELVQTIDLDGERLISHLAFQSGDANWIWKVDLAASVDGNVFEPIAGLQGLDWHAKWGRNEVPITKPLRARHLRLRYWKDGERPNVLRAPSELMVYDGIADEGMEVPKVGRVVTTGRAEAVVQPRSFLSVPVRGQQALGSGAYLMNARMVVNGRPMLLQQPIFVLPPRLEVGSPGTELEFAL